jgi:hypothetical protein
MKAVLSILKEADPVYWPRRQNLNVTATANEGTNADAPNECRLKPVPFNDNGFRGNTRIPGMGKIVSTGPSLEWI